jgi:hypothetical protein
MNSWAFNVSLITALILLSHQILKFRRPTNIKMQLNGSMFKSVSKRLLGKHRIIKPAVEIIGSAADYMHSNSSEAGGSLCL